VFEGNSVLNSKADRASAPPSTEAAYRRRRATIRIAAKMFDEKGYGGTSMDDIATAVGIKKPSLYHYFSSKEEILFAIHEEFLGRIAHAHAERAAHETDPSKLLLGVMCDIISLAETLPGFVRVFFEHHRDLTKAKREIVIAERDQYYETVRQLIVAMSGDSVSSERSRIITFGVFGMCNWTYQWFRPDGPVSSKEVAEIFVQAIQNGITFSAPQSLGEDSSAAAAL
jgi:AcrR family transcriptional regulator